MIHERLRPKPEDLVGKIALKALETVKSTQTRKSGSITVHNADGTKTISGAVLGTDETGTARSSANWVGDTTPPGIPTGITAWSGDGAVHVSWDGTLTGSIPADFCQVNLLVDGVAFASLNSAGSATYNGASAGTTVNVTATSEDNACAIDGTAAHNVSAACTAISVTVTDTAATTTQHFWADTDGAHISSTGDHDTSGFHQLMTSVKNAFMHGTTELMTISESLIELGKNSPTSIIKFCAGNGLIGYDTTSKQLYLSGTDGAYLARKTDIDNGNDSGIGLVDDNGSSLAVLHANRFSLGGPTISSGRFYTAIVPAVLYNGGNALAYDTAPGVGTNGDVTLSETAANFSNLKIFFRTDDNAYGSYEVPFPNGKRVGLSANWSTGTSMWYKARAILISGTSITTVEYGSVNSDGSSFSHSNVIYIVRVEGIR